VDCALEQKAKPRAGEFAGLGKKRRLKEPAFEGSGSSNETLLLLFLGLLSRFLFSHGSSSEIFREVARTYFHFVKKNRA
jgi:hypothetical protein